ncbi:DUF4203 domain-containing protein [Microdochium nivale]|nr:DUF4203 domain-containing protein [Microdochium nivale]
MRLPQIQLFLALMLTGSVVAGPLQHDARQDPSPGPTGEIATVVPPSSATTQNSGQASSTAAESSFTRSSDATPTSQKHSTTTSRTSSISIEQTASSVPDSSTLVTGSEGDDAYNLPLEPRLTPGWGVAGSILVISGLIYTVIGIKNPWLQIFLSTAYIGGVCTTVLVIYLILPPVSDGIQGAYVVAAVLTGLVLGGAATLFKELTEAFACLLGGFCVGMWLLTLKAGGLLPKSSDKIILLTVFTIVGFATYFSRYTRGYALIGFVSFSGATVTVLGIDCFSRAGLKEFWAYIWDINSYLFPSDTTSYPLTKGITVETALIVIITIIGVVSQLKLWRVIRDRRAKKEEKQAEIDRQRDVEETAIGQQIEEENARQRRQWEKTYATEFETPTINSTETPRPASQGGFEGDIASRRASTNRKSISSSETIELAEMTPVEHVVGQQETVPRAAVGLMLPDNNDMSRVTIRVARDVSPEQQSPYERQFRATSPGHDEGAADSGSRIESMQGFTKDEVAPAPDFVPLPFTIPGTAGYEDMDMSCGEDDDDRSSDATFADDDERSMIASKRASRASLTTLGNRLSVGSQHLLRKLSVQSTASPAYKQRHQDAQGQADISSKHSPANHQHISPELKDSTSRPSLGVFTQPSGSIEDPKASAQQEPAQSVETGEVPTITTDLTEDRLPVGLSRTALSYRTNEWAKHLSQAEHPVLERLSIQEHTDLGHHEGTQDQAAAPVDVANLQRTDGGIPRARATRLAPDSLLSSSMHHHSVPVIDPRRSSTQTQVVTEQFPGGAQSGQGGRETVRHTNRRHSGVDKPQAISEEVVNPEASQQSAAGNTNGEDAVSPTEREPWSPQMSDTLDTGRLPIPGIVSYSSPQTLLGQREALLRNKSASTLLPNGSLLGATSSSTDRHSQLSRANQAAQLPDLDDLTLAQRKQLIRQNSLVYQKPAISRAASVASMKLTSSNLQNGYTREQLLGAGEASFNSHQPQRMSSVVSPAQREQALASFRQSVAIELRSSPAARQLPQSQTIPWGLHDYGMGSNLRLSPATPFDSDPTVSLERGRNMLMSQKEQEARRRETEYHQKEQNDRAFEEMMRRGDLIDAHRDALRKMQSTARS